MWNFFVLRIVSCELWALFGFGGNAFVDFQTDLFVGLLAFLVARLLDLLTWIRVVSVGFQALRGYLAVWKFEVFWTFEGWWVGDGPFLFKNFVILDLFLKNTTNSSTTTTTGTHYKNVNRFLTLLKFLKTNIPRVNCIAFSC